VGFALAVTHPFAGNLGGGGFMLIRFANGRSTFIDFRERAPLKAARDMYLDARGNPTRDSVDGWRSAAVPGSVRGFELAQSKYGRKKWAEAIAPAVQLAEKGFPLSYKAAESLRGADNLAVDPESKRIFQKNGAFYGAGDVLIQPEPDSTFYWLQSIDAADLAFVVTDPLLFVPDYQIPLREETRADLGIADLSEASVLVIVNKVGDQLTANLQGPLVIHATSRVAAQIVISEKKYQTRHPILQLQRGTGKPQTAQAAPQYVSKSA